MCCDEMIMLLLAVVTRLYGEFLLNFWEYFDNCTVNFVNSSNLTFSSTLDCVISKATVPLPFQGKVVS